MPPTSAASKSAIISETSSIPTDKRIKSDVTPAKRRSSALNCLCVVLAGCITQVRASATCVTRVASFTFAINSFAASNPPLMPNVKTPLAPFSNTFVLTSNFHYYLILDNSPIQYVHDQQAT